MRLLILGGTTEASALARNVGGWADLDPILSLAGRTQNPVEPPIPFRSGGFGGVDGLKSYLMDEKIDVVVDATGSNLSMARSITYCAFKGRLVYVGITQSDIIMPHAPALHRRELDILASRNALPGDFTRIIALIESGQIDTRSRFLGLTGFIPRQREIHFDRPVRWLDQAADRRDQGHRHHRLETRD